jgi:hypothetical protein
VSEDWDEDDDEFGDLDYDDDEEDDEWDEDEDEEEDDFLKDVNFIRSMEDEERWKREKLNNFD